MSLASKLFWNILLVLAAVLGITGWWSVEDERAALQAVYGKHGKAMAQSLAAFSVEALVSVDYPSLEKALQSIGRSADNIVHLSITRDGYTVASYTRAGVGESFTSPILLGDGPVRTRTIGEASVVLSRKDGEAIISSRINELVLHSLLLFVTLAVALNFLTRRLVTRRLSALSKATEGVIADTPHSQTLPDEGTMVRKGDELDHLRARYRAMMEGLDRREQERSLAVERLREAQALLDDVANSLPSSLIVLSREQQIEYCNHAARELPGYTEDALSTGTLEASFPFLAADLQSGDAGWPKPFELHRQYWITPGGQMIVNIAVYPLTTRSAGGVVIRVDDVTARTRLEEAMIQSEKMLSIGGLATGIAHEMNNPLGVMIQAVQNIERRVSDELPANHRVAEALGTDLATVRAYLEQRSILEFLNDIKSDGARAARIVRSLLEFSRKSEPVFEKASLAELVHHAIDLARKDYFLKKQSGFLQIALEIDVPTDLPPVPMIHNEIEQVLINLVKNAAQAIRDKFPDESTTNQLDEKPLIRIRARAADASVTIEVQDNGPGFTEEARRRAFEPFFTTKAPGMGTGLGLWISYTIIADKHHGEMHLESIPGRGTTFMIRLPT